MHRIILHLNPNDAEDRRIQELVEHCTAACWESPIYSTEFKTSLDQLRAATQLYLKKEWNRVKRESAGDINFK